MLTNCLFQQNQELQCKNSEPTFTIKRNSKLKWIMNIRKIVINTHTTLTNKFNRAERRKFTITTDCQNPCNELPYDACLAQTL